MCLAYRKAAPILNKESQKLFGTIDGINLYNTSTTGVKKHELDKIDDGDYSMERNKCISCTCQDGVKPMTKEELDAERSLDWVLVKKFTMKIFSMDFTRFSFPVGYSEPRSFLERTSDLFSFLATNYLEKAVNADSKEDRLLNVSMGIVSGFQLYMQSKKPWNPVLGETYYGQWPNGVTIYGEQISHHPPISCFQIFGEGWKCSATCKFTILSGIFEIDIVQGGIFSLEFEDNDEKTKIEWEFPTIAVLGILRGDRIVRIQGPLVVKDLTNDVVCSLDIYPKNDRRKGISNSRATTVYGGIKSSQNNDYSITIKGDYCDTVEANGQEVFNIKTDFASRPKHEIDEVYLLPSDSRFRFDRALLLEKRMNEADEAKNLIEEMQRREEKLRL
ncbi:Oxysterol binding protein [Tritrichomonas foetus]|uniref:Oxysterol binding protein n=1 Tax=Tritrichomonas foetus TaxID=1144522 RepID=A0A1J4KUV0_9EUKA|nr:Oxysterol binding protein [Tritrichomonas foetus]|eukprot:OHT13508.1 Oxysterol binding protein [Tritrichomonas foetus]